MSQKIRMTKPEGAHSSLKHDRQTWVAGSERTRPDRSCCFLRAPNGKLRAKNRCDERWPWECWHPPCESGRAGRFQSIGKRRVLGRREALLQSFENRRHVAA